MAAVVGAAAAVVAATAVAAIAAVVAADTWRWAGVCVFAGSLPLSLSPSLTHGCIHTEHFREGDLPLHGEP